MSDWGQSGKGTAVFSSVKIVRISHSFCMAEFCGISGIISGTFQKFVKT